MYYAAANTGPDDWTTRIAAFKFPGCLTDTINISGNAGIAGAVLHYDNPGPLTAIADGSGDYSFLVPSSWTGEVTPVLPHYFFDPPSREYTGILAHQPASGLHSRTSSCTFAPDNGATVCRTPYIIVKIFLSDLTRNANGTFNSSSVTFKLDGGNVLNLSSIRVPQTAPTRLGIHHLPAVGQPHSRLAHCRVHTPGGLWNGHRYMDLHGCRHRLRTAHLAQRSGR